MFIKLSVERKAENDALVEYLAKKCEEAELPLSVDHEIKDFIETRESDTELNALKTFVQKYKETVRGITDEGKRVKQLFCLGVKVDKQLMKELEKHAHVTLDGNKKIVKYVSHDGSIVLEGDQSLWRKRKNALAEKRRSQMSTTTSEAHLEMDLDFQPELQPPATKKERVEDSGNSSETLRQSTGSAAHTGSSPATQRPAPKKPRAEDPSTSSTGSAAPVVKSKNGPVVSPGSSPATQRPAPKKPQNPAQPTSSTSATKRNSARDLQNSAENAGVLEVKQEEPEHPFAMEDVKPELLGNSIPSYRLLSLSNHQSFLQQTKALISTMKLPVGKKMESRITGMIDRIQFRQPNIQQIEIYFFEGTIRHAISLAIINTSKVIQEEDSRSFVQFVLLLQMNIVCLNEPKLKGLQDKLHELCQEPDYQQKKISVSCIEQALESILDVLAPN